MIGQEKYRTLIIIPAYNEAENIVDIIYSLKESYPDYDILVVNDGSQDGTGRLAENTGKAKTINLPHNIGIGGAVQTGFKYAVKHNYDIAVQFDGDGQHMVHEIKKIVEPVKHKEADCMIGSRFMQNLEKIHTAPLRRIGIRIFEITTLALIGQKIKDHTSGFRAYNKEAISFLAKYYPNDYPEPETIIILGKNGFSIKEVFTQMRERQGGITSIPLHRGPYYMAKVLLAMLMSALREKKITKK